MRPRSCTVLGLLLLLAAAPVRPAAATLEPVEPVKMYVAQAELYSPAHRVLSGVKTAMASQRSALAAEAMLALALPLFGPGLARTMANRSLVAAYVPARVLGRLPTIVSGPDPTVAWNPFSPTPVRQALDLLVARRPVPAILFGQDGPQAADLNVTTRHPDPFAEETGGVFVADLNLAHRNASGETAIDPRPLRLVGMGLVCLAPAPRRNGRVRSRGHVPLSLARRLRLHQR
ncbi:conserved exported protein of unknown function [Rhodovastum atsumiense]|nr:conserved exported protein of unknown function [Rhodovastum atsumiense]